MQLGPLPQPRKTLAVVWAVQHFRAYLYGHTVTVITNHSAIKSVLDKPSSNGKHKMVVENLRKQSWAAEDHMYVDLDIKMVELMHFHVILC